MLKIKGFKFKKKKKKSHIPFRLTLLFLVVFVSFLAVLVRLAYVQVVKGEDFVSLVRRTETTTTTRSVPRGLIYDSRGRVLVGNESKLTITYTREAKATQEDMLSVAKRLSEIITADITELKERDLKDYWAVTHKDQLEGLLTKEDKDRIKKENLSNGEVYTLQLEHVPSDELQYSDAEKEIIAIFSKMNAAYAMSTVSIKNKDVSDKEAAEVNERLAELKGIDVMSDWDRSYPMGDMLRSVLGTVTTEKAGLPENMVNSLREKGYSLNDRVGSSYLEQEYEEVLRGSKAIIKSTANSSGQVTTSKEVYPGKAGDNLFLTIDTDFQKKIEDIATKFVEEQSDPTQDRVYIVAMNPQSGDVLGIAGKKRKYDKDGKIIGVEDDALGAINGTFGMGSAVKGATVLAGYMDGVISLDNNQIMDEPIKFAGSNAKSSFFNRDGQLLLNDITALERSSNVYMIRLAMRMGGQYDYVPDGNLDISTDVFDKLRNYYAQFGLGVRTGIDLPNESAGFNGGTGETYSALDFAFGQFDLYTPLQLAQYGATIANNGVRIAPRLVKEIRSSDALLTEGVLQTYRKPQVMNTLQVSQEAIERVKEGFYQVTHGENGTGSRFLANYEPAVVGKTGTAEAFYSGPIKGYQGDSVFNSTAVTYSPAENPNIVVSVVVPYYLNNDLPSDATRLTKLIYDAYYQR